MAIVRRQHRDARLVFVGPTATTDIAGAEFTGAVDADVYRDWLNRASVAVQLRVSTNGESSGAVGDCLTAGVPTIVTAIGPARDLPDDAVVKVGADVDVATLAARITALLDETDARRRLHDGGRRYAAEHSFARAARALYDLLFAVA
jgi:glycosyltransferase involved in cell wall biosynthesis